jgi:hypothetical protein
LIDSFHFVEDSYCFVEERYFVVGSYSAVDNYFVGNYFVDSYFEGNYFVVEDFVDRFVVVVERVAILSYYFVDTGCFEGNFVGYTGCIGFA